MSFNSVVAVTTKLLFYSFSCLSYQNASTTRSVILVSFIHRVAPGPNVQHRVYAPEIFLLQGMREGDSILKRYTSRSRDSSPRSLHCFSCPPCLLYNPHPLWGSLFFSLHARGWRSMGLVFLLFLFIVVSSNITEKCSSQSKNSVCSEEMEEWMGVCDCLAHLDVAGVTLSIGVGVWVGGASPSYCEKLWEVLRSFELCMRKCV